MSGAIPLNPCRARHQVHYPLRQRRLSGRVGEYQLQRVSRIERTKNEKIPAKLTLGPQPAHGARLAHLRMMEAPKRDHQGHQGHKSCIGVGIPHVPETNYAIFSSGRQATPGLTSNNFAGVGGLCDALCIKPSS